PPPHPSSPLFPYTTLFRSGEAEVREIVAVVLGNVLRIIRPLVDTGAFPFARRRHVGDGRRENQPRSPFVAPRPEADRIAGLQIRSEEHTSELQSRSDLVCR